MTSGNGRATAKTQKPVAEHERCEAQSYVRNYADTRCTKRGDMCAMTGASGAGFAILCGFHRHTFEQQGYDVKPLADPANRKQRVIGA